MRGSDKLTLIIICILGVKLGFGEAIEVPCRVNDVLPVSLKEISWPVLNNLHCALDLLPFVGLVTPNIDGDDDSLNWKGACFYENSAKIEFIDGGGDREFGGGWKGTSSAHSWTCMDHYIFATPYSVTWDYYFASSEHKLMIESWEEAAELEYISDFYFPNTAWGQHANLDFLENHMGATFEKRPQPWQATINPNDVHSGDFLSLSKIRGRGG
ncbi:uncharacterized protein LOC141614438 [Silene latifolia]|uniref:uncharacterized protein LOC141614438 n=1 Tax=Silene latifolia TaxID=37657 RepID=UPI003D76E2AB